MQAYLPSNGSEGLGFEAAFCDRCVRQAVRPDSKKQCPHLVKALLGEINGVWFLDAGRPFCTVFRPRGDAARRRKKGKKKDEKQMSLFEKR